MQTPKTVEEFVEEEIKKLGLSNKGRSPELARRCVAFGRTLGLQEALGAGGTRCKPEELAGVAAKNSAISALIEKGEQV